MRQDWIQKMSTVSLRAIFILLACARLFLVDGRNLQRGHLNKQNGVHFPVESISPMVFPILIHEKGSTVVGTGGGIFCSKEPVQASIVTNHHVAQNLDVEIRDGERGGDNNFVGKVTFNYFRGGPGSGSTALNTLFDISLISHLNTGVEFKTRSLTDLRTGNEYSFSRIAHQREIDASSSRVIKVGAVTGYTQGVIVMKKHNSAPMASTTDYYIKGSNWPFLKAQGHPSERTLIDKLLLSAIKTTDIYEAYLDECDDEILKADLWRIVNKWRDEPSRLSTFASKGDSGSLVLTAANVDTGNHSVLGICQSGIWNLRWGTDPRKGEQLRCFKEFDHQDEDAHVVNKITLYSMHFITRVMDMQSQLRIVNALHGTQLDVCEKDAMVAIAGEDAISDYSLAASVLPDDQPSKIAFDESFEHYSPPDVKFLASTGISDIEAALELLDEIDGEESPDGGDEDQDGEEMAAAVAI